MDSEEEEAYVTLTSSSSDSGSSVSDASTSPPPAKRRRAAGNALVPSRQPSRRELSLGSRATEKPAQPRGGPADAAALRRSARRHTGAGQEKEHQGKLSALDQLLQARAATAAAAGAASRRRRRAAAVVDSEEDEEMGKGGPAAVSKPGIANSSSDGEPAQALGVRARGGRRRGRSKFLAGDRDYALSDSGDDLGDFIAPDGAESGSDSGSSEAQDEEEKERKGCGGSPRQAGAHAASGRRAAAAARGLAGAARAAAAAAAWEDDEEGEGGGSKELGRAARRHSGSDGQSDDGEVAMVKSSRGRRRKWRAAAVVASSDSEDELPGVDAGATGAAAAPAAAAPAAADIGATASTPTAKRKRLQRPGEAAPAGTPGSGAKLEERQLQGRHTPRSGGQQEEQATPGSASQRPRRQPPTRPALTAADRIRQAQQRCLGAVGDGGEGSEGEEEEVGAGALELPGTDDDVSFLTDEGDPDAQPSASDGGSGGGSGGGNNSRGAAATPGLAVGARLKEAPRHGGDVSSPGWQRAAEALGLGSYTPQQLFSIYVEYTLLCYVDPSYAETVRHSPRHDEYYQKAIRAVEFEMTVKRGNVASDAWKCSRGGLLQAVETLPGIETGWTDEDGAQELAGMPCDACNRGRSHATRQLILKGVPYQPVWGDAALISNRRLSDQFAQASPAFQKRMRRFGETEEGWDEEAAQRGAGGGSPASQSPPAAAQQGQGKGRYRRDAFHVGRFCCARLTLYHALFHWRRRLLARLKRELSAELRRRQRAGFPTDRSSVADAVLHKDSLMAQLFANYQRLLGLAERYQLSGGEGSRGSWKSEFDGMHAEVAAAQAELHDDSEAEEASVAWPDEEIGDGSDAEAESGRGSEVGGDSREDGEEEEEEEADGRQRRGQQQEEQVLLNARQGGSGDAYASRRASVSPPIQQQAGTPQQPASQPRSNMRQIDIRHFFARRQGPAS